MSNTLFQNALKRIPQKTPPIWFMRQAGRYHKHYQALRAKHSFIELCKNADLAAEVTRGPVAEFDFDVAILFSDLLFPLEAMGMGLKYEPAPELDWYLTDSNLKDLRTYKEALPELQFQKKAMQKCREVLPKNKSLIGFVGGPWTLFTYACEGAHKGSLQKTKSLLAKFPQFCEILMPLLKENIQLQFDGGAEVVMIFDTAAGELSPKVYQNLVVPQLARLAAEFPKKMGYYAKGNTLDHYVPELVNTAWAGLGFDHRFNLASELKKFMGGFVQGNFDQALLFLPEAEFKKELDLYLSDLQKLTVEERAGWVSGLGHGVLPQTPEAHVKYMVQRIREVMS